MASGHQFAGTRRFSSSNQFCTRIMFERAAAGFRPVATADDQEPSIGGDVVRPSPTRWRRTWRIRTTPADARRRASSRTAPAPQASADRPGCRRTVPGRHATRAGDGRRPSRSVADFRAPDTARRRSPSRPDTFDCRPSSVRLETRPRSRCRTRFSAAPSRRTGARSPSARSRTDTLGDTSLNRSCLPSADQPLAQQIEEILGTREEPLVAAGAIRRPPEQLRVARSCRRKDDALPVGRPERAAVRRRVGRQPAQRGARDIVRPHIVWVASASRAPSGDTRTSRYESGGRPGSGEARPWRSTDTTVRWPPPPAAPGT